MAAFFGLGAQAFADSAFLQHDSKAALLRPEAGTARPLDPSETARLENKYWDLIKKLSDQLGQVTSAEGFRRLFQAAKDGMQKEENLKKQEVFDRGVDLSSLTFEEKKVAREQFARFLSNSAGGAIADSLTTYAGAGSEAAVLLGNGSATPSATRAIRGFHTVPRR